MSLNCEYSSVCAEVADPANVFGDEYVGHDEPSLLFYSKKPGSGSRMQYNLSLPRDPSPSHPNTPGKSYQFQLNGAFWFGMALCDTQSYPEQISTCPASSDSNIVNPAVSPKHPGTAFLEMQFYPPGWIPWPTWAVAVGASGCDPTKWCAALNIDSLSEDPVNGTTQNATCANRFRCALRAPGDENGWCVRGPPTSVALGFVRPSNRLTLESPPSGVPRLRREREYQCLRSFRDSAGAIVKTCGSRSFRLLRPGPPHPAVRRACR